MDAVSQLLIKNSVVGSTVKLSGRSVITEGFTFTESDAVEVLRPQEPVAVLQLQEQGDDFVWKPFRVDNRMIDMMVTHLFGGDSWLTAALQFFLGAKPVSSSTHA